MGAQKHSVADLSAAVAVFKWASPPPSNLSNPPSYHGNPYSLPPTQALAQEKFSRTRTDKPQSYLQTGKLQQTVANCIERTGLGLHSGDISTVKILPAAARAGRCFIFRTNVIRASIDNAAKDTPLCTALSKDGFSVRTVEHLLSALEACGVDNCRIEIEGSNNCDRSVEVIASFPLVVNLIVQSKWCVCIIVSWLTVLKWIW